MKIDIKREIIKTINVELPVYRKSTSNWFKVYKENRCIRVSLVEDFEEISNTVSSIAFMYDTESNEEEFNEAFKKADAILKSLIK